MLRLLDLFQDLLNVIVIAIGKLPRRAYRVLIDGIDPLELQPSRTFELDGSPSDRLRWLHERATLACLGEYELGCLTGA